MRKPARAPDDETSKKTGGARPITVGIDGGVLKKLDNVRIHLADNEDLHIEQLLQAIMRKICGERTVAHAHVGILSRNDVAISRLGLQTNWLVK